MHKSWSVYLHLDRDDHFYQIQHDRSRVLQEKDTIEKVYQTLLEEHRTLQTNFDDVTSEKAEALATVRRLQTESEGHRDDKAEPMLKAEIDRLRIDLYDAPLLHVNSRRADRLLRPGRRARTTSPLPRRSWIGKQFLSRISLARSTICRVSLTRLRG
jgi:hypothetical protein